MLASESRSCGCRIYPHRYIINQLQSQASGQLTEHNRTLEYNHQLSIFDQHSRNPWTLVAIIPTINAKQK